MELIFSVVEYLPEDFYLVMHSPGPEVDPGIEIEEPETLPAEPKIRPIPDDDPFNVPAPLIDPTPKGFVWFRTKKIFNLFSIFS
jgi:hypothetical protein